MLLQGTQVNVGPDDPDSSGGAFEGLFDADVDSLSSLYTPNTRTPERYATGELRQRNLCSFDLLDHFLHQSRDAVIGCQAVHSQECLDVEAGKCWTSSIQHLHKDLQCHLTVRLTLGDRSPVAKDYGKGPTCTDGVEIPVEPRSLKSGPTAPMGGGPKEFGGTKGMLL